MILIILYVKRQLLLPLISKSHSINKAVYQRKSCTRFFFRVNLNLASIYCVFLNADLYQISIYFVVVESLGEYGIFILQKRNYLCLYILNYRDLQIASDKIVFVFAAAKAYEFVSLLIVDLTERYISGLYVYFIHNVEITI